MEDPHPYTEVELNERAVAIAGREHNNAMFKYGTYTKGEAIRYRTLNPGGSEAYGGGEEKPRKTGLGLPWDLIGAFKECPICGNLGLLDHTV